MDIKDRIRTNLDRAIRAWIAAAAGRSRRKAAIRAKVNYDHLSKFLKPGGPWLDIDKIAAVCKAIDVQVSSLMDEELRTPDSHARLLPVIHLSRIRAMDTPGEVVAEIRKISTEQRPYPTSDPQAFWIDLDTDVGAHLKGSRVLISPSTPVLDGDLVAAFPAGAPHPTIGIYTDDSDGQLLVISMRERSRDFLVLGFVEFIGSRPNVH